ncbi:MAG: MFS transporter [Actinomycetota bacterium]|nr:MFS transporter [Actinomycetota bacterium]
MTLAGVVSHTFGRSTMPLLLPAIADDLGLNATTSGATGSVNMAAYLCGVIAVTYLANRLAPALLMKFGLWTVLAGLLSLGTAQNTWQVMIGTGLAGLGGAGIWLTMPVIATAGVPAAKRGMVMGSLTATMGVASIIVPFATSALRKVANDGGAWREIWLAEIVAASAILAVLYMVLRDDISPKLPLGAGIKAITRLQGWKTAVFFYMAFAFVASSWFQFFGLSLENDHNMSREFTTHMWALMGIGGVIGALTFGRLSDHLGRPRTMCIVTAAGATTCLLVLVGEPWAAALAAAIYGTSAMAVPSLTATFVRDQVDEHDFTAVFGAMTIFYGPASVLGPISGGVLADITGSYRLTYVLLGVTFAFASVAAWRLPRIENDN